MNCRIFCFFIDLFTSMNEVTFVRFIYYRSFFCIKCSDVYCFEISKPHQESGKL